jgi:hypothetical protein
MTGGNMVLIAVWVNGASRIGVAVSVDQLSGAHCGAPCVAPN